MPDKMQAEITAAKNLMKQLMARMDQVEQNITAVQDNLTQVQTDMQTLSVATSVPISNQVTNG